MASAAVYAAFKTAIETAWEHTLIAFPNSSADAPESNVAFLSVTYPFARERQISIGAPGQNTFRTEGGLLITLCIPSGTALDASATTWLARLDALRAALRGKTFGVVETFGASPAIPDESSDRGGYYVVSFAVEYQADVIG